MKKEQAHRILHCLNHAAMAIADDNAKAAEIWLFEAANEAGKVRIQEERVAMRHEESGRAIYADAMNDRACRGDL